MTTSTLPLAPGAEAPPKYPAAEPDRDLPAVISILSGSGGWSV